jgi:hypothetical protein
MMQRIYAVVLAVGFAAGCRGMQEDATASAAEAIEPASNATDSPEMAGLLMGLIGGPDRDSVEGFRCDSTPQVTNVTVCDKQFPSEIHLDWTSCSLQPPAPPPGTDTSQLPPPPGGGPGGMFQGTSAGTVDVTLQVTLDPSTTCGEGEKFQLSGSTTFSVQRSGPFGHTMSASGNTTSIAELSANGQETKTTQLDVTRSFDDGSGDGRSVHLTGTVTVSFDDSSGSIVRTLNGTLQAELSGGNAATIQITNLVRPAPWVCPWPTSGTVVRTDAGGTAHTLAYGPACGQATLDGEDITMRGPPGGGGCGGMQPPSGGGSIPGGS